MAPLSRVAAPAARAWARHALPTVRPTTASLASFSTNQSPKASTSAAAVPTSGQYRPNTPDTNQTSTTFDSPFHRSGGTMRETTDIPKFDHYKSSRDETTNRVFQYFMVGTFGAVTAMGAKATVQGEFNSKAQETRYWSSCIQKHYLY